MIAIVGGCGANIASVQFALERLGKKSIVTIDQNIIQSASHVVLPGVGTANHAMAQLRKYKLQKLIQKLQQPVLGICLGMQLLFEYSEEGASNCLGILPGKISLLPNQKDITLPHMGWNQLTVLKKDSMLMQDIKTNEYVYFVHSYAAPINDDTVATTCHGKSFSAIVEKNNFYGVQFHPEKSGKTGEIILRNFVNS